MILIEDTRQKANKHKNILSYCRVNGIKLYPLTLQVGDYMLGCENNGKIEPVGKISVDTKQDIEELANDLFRDNYSLNKKYRKCYEQGIHLIILIEQPCTKKYLSTWHSKYYHISGKQLIEQVYKIKFSYGVEFKFCDRKDTAKTIIELLNKE